MGSFADFAQNANQFVEGAKTGADTTMNLYEKFQELQDVQQQRNLKRNRAAKMEEMARNKEFDDPAKAFDTLGQYDISQGDWDNYLQTQQMATQLKKTAGDKAALGAFAIGSKDPVAAAGLINEAFKNYGEDVKVDIKQTPDKKYVITSNVNGKAYDEVFDSAQDAHHAMMAGLEPFLFKDYGDYAKTKSASEQAQAAADKDRAQISESQALLPGKQQLQQAQITAEGAQANAANASAAANMAQAKYAGPKAAAEIARDQAITANQQDQQQWGGITKTIDEDTKAAEAGANPGSFVVDRGTKELTARGIAENNPGISPPEAAATMMSIYGNPTAVQFDDSTGQVRLPNGKVYNLGLNNMMQVKQTIARLIAPPPQ